MATPKSKAPRAPKTQPTTQSVKSFLAELDEARRADCAKVDAWMREATGVPGVMYGRAIVGYGSTMVRYADGHEAPWPRMGFSPRKQALTLYGVLGSATPALLKQLGKHSTGKGCLYVKRLADVDADALQKIIRRAAT